MPTFFLKPSPFEKRQDISVDLTEIFWKDFKYQLLLKETNNKQTLLFSIMFSKLEHRKHFRNTEKPDVSCQDDLAYQVDLCKKKLDRAETLIE